MSCVIESKTTKNESELGQKLIKITGSIKEALSLYNSFATPEFIENFGDWIADYNDNTFLSKGGTAIDFPRTNTMGEPQLYKYDPTNPSNNNYYYIDKYGNKQPVDINGLNTWFTTTQLNNLASSFVAYSYNKVKFNLKDFNKELSNLNKNIDNFLEENGNRLELEYSLLINIINNDVKEGKNTNIDRIKLEEKEKSLANFYYIDENREDFKRNIIEYLNTFDISVRYNQKDIKQKKELETEIIIGRENEGRTFEVASYEKNSKDSVSKDLKMELRFIKSSESTDIFGNPTFIPFDDLWSTLINLLHDPYRGKRDGRMVDVFQDMYNKINNLAKIKPDLNNLLEKLDNYTPIQKSRFVHLGMSKINHNLTTFSGTEGNLIFDIKNLSSAFSGRTFLINEWGDNIANNFFRKKEGTVLKNKLRIFTEKFNNFIERYNSNLRDKTSKSKPYELKKEFNDLLNELGIKVNDNAFALYLEGFTLNEGVTSNDDKSVLKRLSGAIDSTSYYLETLSTVSNISEREEAINVLENQQSFFNDLASLEALLKSNLAGDSINAGGKSYYTFTLPSFLSQSINIFKNSRESLRNMRDSDYYVKNSVDIKYLLAEDEDFSPKQQLIESERRLQDIVLFYFNSFKKDEAGTNSVDNAEISYTDSYTDYINKELAPMKGGKAIHRTLTPADKKTSMEYILGKFRQANAEMHTVDGISTVTVNKEIEDIFIGYIADEYSRAKEAFSDILKYRAANIGDKNKLFKKFKIYKHLQQIKQEDGSLKWELQDKEGNYVGNAFKIFTFPSLNGFDTEINTEIGLWNKDNSPTNVDINNADENFTFLTKTQVKGIRKVVQKAISERIKSNHFTALEENVLTVAKKDNIQKGITEGDIINNTIDKIIWSNYLHTNNPGVAAIGDFTVNGLISNIEYSKIFQGDPAYYKSENDYKKRATGPYTTGLYPRIKPGNDSKNLYFKIAVIDSIVGPSNYSEELKAILGHNAYDDTNIADAQAWITPARWKYLIENTKDWNEDYIRVYEKISGKYNKPLTKAQQKIAAQPLKGVYFEKNIEGEPILLKYSQFVIHDKLAVDNGLEVIYNKMLQNNIDEVLTLDAIKVGAGLPSNIVTSELKLKDSFKFNTLELDNRWWKIQQDLTPKGIKENSLLSSQLMKNIFNSLKFAGKEETFNWQGQELDSNQITNVIEELVGRLSDIGATELKSEWGIGEDGVITNENSFYNSLIDEYKNSKGYDLNVIKALQNHSSPLAIIQTYPKMLSIMLSMIDKRTIKLTTPGGGFIQTSNFGIDDLTSLEQNGIVWFNRMGRKGLKPPLLRDSLEKSKSKKSGYTGNITPSENIIFVFGSNPEGRHGAGAAKIARNKFGAIYGQGEGLQGNSYALPTKDLRIKKDKGFRSISNIDISKSINTLYRVAMENPSKTFKIGYRNKANEKTLNGYTGKEMIDMFNNVSEVIGYIPPNIQFSEEWVNSGLINNYFIYKTKKIITPGQILLSADKFREYFPGVSIREVKDLIDKDVLQVLGYRIPNQATSSSTPVEIVGILPEGLGDTVVAYSEITKQSGSDFDIDKLYLMMNAIQQDKDTKRVSIVKPKRKTSKETITTTKPFKLTDIEKPNLEIEFLSDLELVESDSPVANRDKQEVIKKEYEELQNLINCLWA